jgi:adenosylcobinamide-phosphate synthase
MAWLYYNLDDRIFLLALASYVALLIGGPRWLHAVMGYDAPARYWRNFLRVIEARLNRPQRHVLDRLWRGKLVLIIALLIACIAGCVCVALTSLTPYGWVFEVCVAAYLMPIRAGLSSVIETQRMIKQKKLVKIPELLQPITDTDVLAADGHMLIRIAVAHTAIYLPRYVIAPAFWYILLGMPALMVCRLLSCLSDLFPQSHKRYRSFANAAHFWDKAMQLVPVRFSMIILWLGVFFVPKGRVRQVVQAFTRQPAEPAITTRNLPVRFAAYAFGWSLAGPRPVDGVIRPDSWIGNGKARLDNTDLSRALLWAGCNVGLWLSCVSFLSLMLK